MFRTNLKIAWRNLVNNKIYSTTNIGGLAVGISAFIMMLLYQTHLASFDAWDSSFKNVYEIRIQEHSKNRVNEDLSPLLIPLLQQKCPEIEAATRVNSNSSGELLRVGDIRIYQGDIVSVDSTFFEVYPLQLKEGNRNTALNDPHSMVITEEVAKKFFGNQNPMGKAIRFDETQDYIVTGILAPAKGPTNIDISVLKRIKVPGWAGWGNFAYNCFVKLKPGTNTKLFAEKITNIYFDAAYDILKRWYKWPDDRKQYMRIPKHDALDVINVPALSLEHAKMQLFVLSLLSAVIVVVACMNFTNQSIANSDSRAKEIGIRKALGAMRGSLTSQFLIETLLQCTFAVLVSFILVELLLPAFNQLTWSDIKLLKYCTQPGFVSKILLTLAAVTLLAGIYPAFYLSGYKPVLVLKGIFDRGTGGMLLRRFLLSLQFVFSVTFVIALVIISRQTSFMQHYDLGFKPEEVTYIQIKEDSTGAHFDYVQQQLLQIPHVKKVGFTDFAPFVDEGGNYTLYSYQGAQKDLRFINISRDFFAAMGATIIDGRDFSAATPSDSTQSIIVNEAFVHAYNMKGSAVGQLVTEDFYRVSSTSKPNPHQYRIVGVVKDFMILGFEKGIEPIIFYNNAKSAYYAVLKSDQRYINETMRSVTALWKNVEPAHPILMSNVKNSFSKVIGLYDRLQKVVYVFAVVTIIIALVGLLALVAYNLKRRMKEIGIRKVVGASLGDILQMLNAEFLGLLLVANLFAWFIAYVLMRSFLNEFEYRIPMPYFVFPVVTICSAVLTIVIISMRVMKAIRTTPAEVLKYE
ncbi:ABC transporter permease [Deminuibacter soli]|uniref:ABC transporter permease n=1 Tax=Deminuibacter soli TaxID=2291815 RepID=A0A3E1NJC1_9BACT|nr:ABC transporter permease [Deminuibacter soli]RFM28036.1 ABC transporter permease [Deminuibacter soli]